MRSDDPIHALIELKHPAAQDHFLIFRAIQGEPARIAELMLPILKRNPRIRSAREMLLLLGLHPHGSPPELLDSLNTLSREQKRQTRRYEIHFTPMPIMIAYPNLTAKEIDADYRGPLSGFVASYASELTHKTPAAKSAHEKRMARQRKRRKERAEAGLPRDRKKGELKRGDRWRPDDPASKRFLGMAWEMAGTVPVVAQQWTRPGESLDQGVIRFSKMPQSAERCIAQAPPIRPQPDDPKVPDPKDFRIKLRKRPKE